MSTYPAYRPRGGVNRLLGWADEFMNWFLYGHETWLVAVLKGVPLFLFIYFMLTYIPNYAYYLITVEIPFLRFSDDFGFLVAAISCSRGFGASGGARGVGLATTQAVVQSSVAILVANYVITSWMTT